MRKEEKVGYNMVGMKSTRKIKPLEGEESKACAGVGGGPGWVFEVCLPLSRY